jgi:hypothetical protein
MATAPLFPASLITPSQPPPAGYTVRPLSRDDHSKGYFDCLRTLTWVADPTQQQFEEQYDWLATKGAEWFYNVVIEFEGKIVGTGVIIVERKLYVCQLPFPFPTLSFFPSSPKPFPPSPSFLPLTHHTPHSFPTLYNQFDP